MSESARPEDPTPLLITGSVLSGSDLALRFLAPDLTVEETATPRLFNQPVGVELAIRNRDITRAIHELDACLANPCSIVHSTLSAFLLPHYQAQVRVIAVYRDLRLSLASLLMHAPEFHDDLENSYWHAWCDRRQVDDTFSRALGFLMSSYRAIAQYRGPLEIWDYGFQDGWGRRSIRPHRECAGFAVGSGRLAANAGGEEPGSNRPTDSAEWDSVCETFSLSHESRSMIDEANRTVKKMFYRRGHAAKSYDGRSTPRSPGKESAAAMSRTHQNAVIEMLKKSRWFQKKLERIKDEDPNIYPLY